MLRWTVPVQRPAPAPERPQGLCLDKGYDFDEVRKTLHESSRPTFAAGAKRFRPSEAGFKARRWVVERTHSPLSTHSDKSPGNYIAFLHFGSSLSELIRIGRVSKLVPPEQSINNCHSERSRRIYVQLAVTPCPPTPRPFGFAQRYRDCSG